MDMFSSPPIIWFLVGLVLLMAEFFVPGIFILFFGLGAWFTALALWIFPLLTLNMQLFIFIVVSVVLLILLRRFFREKIFGRSGESEQDALEDLGGSECTVTVGIPKGGFGKAEFKGASWEAFADTAVPAGTRVKIVGKDGIKLKVKIKNDGGSDG